MSDKDLFYFVLGYINDLEPSIRVEIDTSYYALSQVEPITNGSCTEDGYILIYMDKNDPKWEEALFMLVHEVGHHTSSSSWVKRRSSRMELEADAWTEGMFLLIEAGITSRNSSRYPEQTLLESFLKFAWQCLKSYQT